MAREALGREFDVCVGAVPYDTNAGASTGKRVSMKNCGGATVVVYKGAGSGTDDPVLTFQQHTAASAGTSSNLVTVDHYYKKTATTLAGTETWTKVTQAASATVTLTGDAQKQGVYVFEIDAGNLSDGYGWISLNVADTGAAGAQLGAVLVLPRDLHVMRTPANLANPNA